jgi:hypothetical protein
MFSLFIKFDHITRILFLNTHFVKLLHFCTKKTSKMRYKIGRRKQLQIHREACFCLLPLFLSHTQNVLLFISYISAWSIKTSNKSNQIICIYKQKSVLFIAPLQEHSNSYTLVRCSITTQARMNKKKINRISWL